MKREIPACWINESQARESKPPGGLALFSRIMGVGRVDAVLALLLYISTIILDLL